MRLVTTDAIVLRSYNLAESDRIVICLTRSSGLVRAVAKGARRMKSRFGAALEPFTLVKLSLHEKENRELMTVSSAEILESHFDLSGNFESAEVLAYMGEMVAEFAPPHETDERLFRMLSACVDALAQRSGSERALMRYFEIWLLRLAGLFPDFRACAGCGLALETAAMTTVDTQMRALCENCGRVDVSVLTPESIKIIRATHQLSPLNFVELHKLTDREYAEIGDLTHRLITRAIERRPRTLVASIR
ncbi:MAG TPA: DNA repair protein RecO [Pyrinomonadaceae bacterium]|jgi:DNA repair protein RecO (recombination protein O)|nr:DNA repair protein RecO [Pyrinomonadaceae bacterium]